ncbi:putative N-acetlymuramoyl-L-alanine amidase CwlA [Brevibacillus phage SecTim467]|uniref:N-acetylmuramoyl-L-alanine amidase n=2 Tax=Jenstvirus jenst TaxID=1982225 RepID=A0A0K2CPP8_9CAUD|nr:endolysin [Brevibacillus phage Jenst]ALA07186.1 putative N-acetylmuramoyl-L-alanine amidase CwlA [Brevibacillus phage Jenst]ALA07554.1 putative N-acetlymuramoyl-L-alanine amidase CwlA [Brevibacillus phage SecTim467]
MSFKMKYPIEKKYLPNKSKRRSGILIPKVGFIVAHDTGNDGSTALGNINWYTNTAYQQDPSAHTFIDDQHIVECIPATTGAPEKAWHVLYEKTIDNELFGDDANDIAIGVELCYSYKKGSINNAEAYKRYVWYMAYLCYKFGLDPATKITGHFILDPERKTDPQNALTKYGKNFDILVKDVVAEYKACTAGETPKSKVLEDDSSMKLNDWAFDMLVEALTEFKSEGYFTDDAWIAKAKNKTLTASELAFLNTIMLKKAVK